MFLFLGGMFMNYQELAELLFPHVDKTPEYYEKMFPLRDLKEGAIVTRFAPSPTGFMHLGNLYGAFINSCFAKDDGVFYLRIEDTDSKREVEGAKEAILNALDYFQIDYSEGFQKGGSYGPYLQSERKEIYQTFAKDLVRRGLAYPCFCSSEKLEEIRKGQEYNKERLGYYGEYAMCRDLSMEEIKTHLEQGDPYVLRLHSQGDFTKTFVFHDCIKGKIVLPENDTDVVLLKQDGIPTYHFAHAVDDSLMHTTHVIRGDEWLSSVPLHLELFQAIGKVAPKYAHIAPLTKKENGNTRKLSKRKDPEAAVSYYREMGIPPEAVRLYMATLANTNFEEWYLANPDQNEKDFSFSFDHMPIGGTLVDMEKLHNISKTYLSTCSAEDIFTRSLTYFKEYDPLFAKTLEANKERVIAFLDIERHNERPRKDIISYKDVKYQSSYMIPTLFFQDEEETYQEVEKKEYDLSLLEEYLNVYSREDDDQEWYERMKSFAISHGYAGSTKEYKQNPDAFKGHIGDICETLRRAVTGRTRTPSLCQILKIMNQDEIKKRIRFFANWLEKK